MNIPSEFILATTQQNGLVIEQDKLNQSKTIFGLNNH